VKHEDFLKHSRNNFFSFWHHII